MQATKLHSLWIMLLSGLATLNICGKAFLKHIVGNINRAWVDKTIANWAKQVLNLAHVKCIIVNPRNVEPQSGHPTIIMSNHSSIYDIPLIFKVFPNHSIRMLAKIELTKFPIIKQGMDSSEFLFIDRKKKHQAIKDLEKVRTKLQSGIVMWIAPEGTRSKTGALGPFKKGGFITAIEAKATIIPIGIRGAFQILPPHRFQPNLNQITEIHIGEPIDASLFTLDERDTLVAKVHDAIEVLCGPS